MIESMLTPSRPFTDNLVLFLQILFSGQEQGQRPPEENYRWTSEKVSFFSVAQKGRSVLCECNIIKTFWINHANTYLYMRFGIAQIRKVLADEGLQEKIMSIYTEFVASDTDLPSWLNPLIILLLFLILTHVTYCSRQISKRMELSLSV